MEFEEHLQKRNKAKIIVAMADKPLSFQEIQNITRLSRHAVNTHIKALQKENRLEKSTVKECY